MHAIPKSVDNRLRDFLVAIYLKRKRNDEALHLTWIQFEERPTLEHYQKLSTLALKLGLWSAQRARALTLATRTIENTPSAPSRWTSNPFAPDFSLLLEIALWEKDIDAA